MASLPSTPSANSKKYVYDVLPDGEYEGRLVRMVGLGVQPQPAFTDRKTGITSEKKPAYKAAITFELVANGNGDRPMATGKIFNAEGEEEGIIDPKPACQFKDYFINPRAKNSGILNLVQMVDPSITALSSDLDWYKEKLIDQPFSITVGNYTNKAGVVKNKIVAINPIPQKYRKGVAEAQCPLIYFEPYTDNEEMLSIYNNELYPFQRNDLAAAVDKANIVYAGREPERRGDEQRDPTSTTSGTPTQESPMPETFDDDCPF